MASDSSVVSNERIVVRVQDASYAVGVLGVPNLHRVALSIGGSGVSGVPPINADLLNDLARADVQAVLFWDPNLSADEAAAASDDEATAITSAASARAFVEAMIPTYNVMAKLGITTIMHAELGPSAWMFRSASADICKAFSFDDPKLRQRARWVLRRLVSFVGLPQRSAVERVLPRQIRAARPWRDEALVLFEAPQLMMS